MRFNNLDNWLNFSAQGRTEKLKRMGGDTEWGGGILRKINYFVKYLTTKGITGWGGEGPCPPPLPLYAYVRVSIFWETL